MRCTFYNCDNPAFQGYCAEHKAFRDAQVRNVKIAEFFLGITTGIFMAMFVWYVFVR